MKASVVRLLLAACRSIEMLPLSWALALGRAVGVLLHFLLPGKRRIARRNLDLVYGDRWSVERKRRLVRRMFACMGRHAVEFAQLRAIVRRRGRWVSLEGAGHLENALALGRGVLVAGGHIGNWDLACLMGRASRTRASFVTRRLRNPVFDEFWRRQRMSIGAGVIDARNPRELLRRLRANEIVLMVVDQNRRANEGIFLPFLGIPACTTDAPARLALKWDVPLLTASARMERGGRHRIRIEPEVRPGAHLEPGEAARAMTAECLRRLERGIDESPEQWIWLHRRWRTRPPGEPAIYTTERSVL